MRLSVSDFVAAPTANALWTRLQGATFLKAPIVAENIPVETPVSAQQRRALVAHDIGRPSLANIVLLFRMEGRLDEGLLARAMERAARRHFLLRSGFLQTSGGVVLRDTEKFPQLERRILQGRDFNSAVAGLAQSEEKSRFRGRLDGNNPWIRWLLVSGPRNKNRHLMLITHHAVADGWSLELLLDELRETYNYRGGGLNQRSAKDYRVYSLSGRPVGSQARRQKLRPLFGSNVFSAPNNPTFHFIALPRWKRRGESSVVR